MAAYDADKLLSQFAQAPAINDSDRMVLGDADDPNKVLYASVSDLKAHFQRGIDDTPVDSETNESITSNWAYDHAAAYATHAADITTLHLPNQSGQSSGSILMTDGSVASWTTAPKLTSLVSASAISIQGWSHDIPFTPTSNITVTWGGTGKITLANGDFFEISSGTTGNMSVVTYIYFDKNESETALQKSTDVAETVGFNKILICVAENVASSKAAVYHVFGGNQDYGLITASNIVSNTITANEIYGNTITASEIASGTITATQIFGNTITTSELAFIPVEDDNVIAYINASPEGIRIEADNIHITGTTTFSSGYNPTNAIGTFTSTTVSNQKVVIDGSDATLRFFNTSGVNVLTIDDGLYDSKPGIEILDTVNGACLMIGSAVNSFFYITDATMRMEDTSVTKFSVSAAGSIFVAGTCELKQGVDITGDITVSGTVDDVDIAARDHAQSHTHDSHTGTLSISEGGTGGTSFSANRVIVSHSTNPYLTASSITAIKLGYLSAVTSSIQTQLNGKASTSHSHSHSSITGISANQHHTAHSGASGSFTIGLYTYDFSNGLITGYHQ